MNHRLGIIAASLALCAVAGPVRAELSADSGAAPSVDAGVTPNPVSLVLAKYAVDGQSMISTPISEISSIVAVTKTSGPMNAYYSVTGSDNQQVIAATSAAPPYFSSTLSISGAGGPTQIEPAPSLAALTLAGGSILIGSNAVVSGENVAPLSAASSSPIVTNSNSLNMPIIVRVSDTPQTPETPSVPIPLPFFLTGSGLAVLLPFRRRGVTHAAV